MIHHDALSDSWWLLGGTPKWAEYGHGSYVVTEGSRGPARSALLRRSATLQEDRGVCSPRITATHDLVVNGTHSQRWAFSQVIRRLAQEHLDLLRVIILNDRTK